MTELSTVIKYKTAVRTVNLHFTKSPRTKTQPQDRPLNPQQGLSLHSYCAMCKDTGGCRSALFMYYTHVHMYGSKNAMK